MQRITPDKLASWYRQLGPAVRLYVAQWINPSDAEDVVQELFTKLTRQPREPANVRAWLFRAARHAAVNATRSRRRRSHHEAASALLRPAHRGTCDETSALDAKLAQQAIDQLPREQREVIVLRIWGQLEWKEIAATTGCPVSTAFSRYQRGLDAVRARLESTCTSKRTND
ncbi:MAG: RNA polymerase sigma factor [Phycisphaeraceae bacterium]